MTAAHATRFAQHVLTVDTGGRGMVELTRELERFVVGAGVSAGLVNVFTHHTSCSLLITENADPAVRRDLERWFARAVADGDPLFEHDDEGPDDMSAHVRSVLTATSIGVPVTEGRPALGTWQGLYLWEHRAHPHRRRVTFTLTGI